jgi:hypothetical protein
MLIWWRVHWFGFSLCLQSAYDYECLWKDGVHSFLFPLGERKDTYAFPFNISLSLVPSMHLVRGYWAIDHSLTFEADRHLFLISSCCKSLRSESTTSLSSYLYFQKLYCHYNVLLYLLYYTCRFMVKILDHHLTNIYEYIFWVDDLVF